MIGYFPKPYDNELYFSLIARYDFLFMNPRRQTVTELFGINKDLDVEYPLGLSELVKKLEIYSPTYTVSYFLENHTMYSFYKIFHENLFYEEISTNNFNFRFSYPRKRRKRDLEIKFCKKCLKEHYEKYGDFYLNRVHQIPGVLVCIKHKISLNLMKNSFGHNSLPRSGLPLKVNLEEDSISIPKILMEELLQYAEDIQYIFANKIPNISLNEISEKYRDLLKIKGIGYPINKRVENSMKLIEETYSPEFIKYFSLEIKESGDWISDMLNNVVNDYDYVKHIVFMRALAGTVKNFFEETFEYKPFGSGPWICMNPFCSKYGIKTIKDIEIGVHTLTGLVYGAVKCKCGFNYRLKEGECDPRKVPYFTNRVIERGIVWEDTVYKLRERNYLIEEIAEMADVSRPTIRKFLNNSYKPRWTGLEDHRKKKTEKYKGEWLDIQKENPSLSRSKLSSLNRAAYAWLWKYEPEWIEKNLPESYKGKSGKQIKVAEESIINNIKNLGVSWGDFERNTGKLRRRTLKLLRAQVKIPTNYERYPKIHAAIDEYKESLTDFRKRKVKHYLDTECTGRGRSVKYHEVAEKTGLRSIVRLGDEQLKIFILEEIKKHNTKFK